MKFSHATLCAIVAASTAAFPHFSTNPGSGATKSDPYPFLGVPLNGVRGPCPAHNTLANHGFIPRDGRGVTKEIITHAVHEVFNIGPEIIRPVAERALAICSFITQSVCSEYNLDMLSTPHMIEHDGSLSRNDYMMPWSDHADNHSFNQTVFDRTLEAYGPGTHIDIVAANTGRVRRLEQSMQDDLPGYFELNEDVTTTETAFILFAMNDHFINPDLTRPLARKEWVKYWFEYERLPTDLGFVKQTTFPGAAYITSLAGAVLTAPTLTPTTTSFAATTATSVRLSSTSPTTTEVFETKRTAK